MDLMNGTEKVTYRRKLSGVPGGMEVFRMAYK